MSSSESVQRLPLVSREPVTDLPWLDDGLTLLAVLGDGQAVFWNSETGKTLRVLQGLGPGLISSDGRKLVSHIPPHWRTARGPFGMMLRTWDKLTGEPGMTLVPLLGERSSPDAPRRSAWFAVAPDGRVHGSANVEQELVYVVQTDKGQETLTTAEFQKRFGK